MRLADYRQIIEQRINKQSNTSTFKGDINDEIVNALQWHANQVYPWNELRQLDSFSTVINQYEYYLPSSNDIDKIINIFHKQYEAYTDIEVVNHRKFFGSMLSTTGTRSEPLFAIIEQKVGVYTQPSTASTLTVYSSSTSDTTQQVRIHGIVNNQPDFETIDLNGTTAANGTKSFSKVYGFCKTGATVGYVTLEATPTTLGLIPAGKTTLECKYSSIKLYPIPSSEITIYFYYKRKQYKLYDDNDFSILSDDHDNAILLLAEYLILREPKTMALYEAALKELIAKEEAVMDEPAIIESRFSSNFLISGLSTLGNKYAVTPL